MTRNMTPKQVPTIAPEEAICHSGVMKQAPIVCQFQSICKERVTCQPVAQSLVLKCIRTAQTDGRLPVVVVQG